MLWGLVLGLAACHSELGATNSPSTGYSGPVNRCRVDSDCAQAQRCDSDLDLCISTMFRNRRFIVTLSNADMARQGLPPIILELESISPGELRLQGPDAPLTPLPVLVSSRVRAAANSLVGLQERPVRAELAFVSLAQRAAGLDIQPVPGLSALADGQFQLYLHPGHYSLEVRPLLDESSRTPVALFEHLEVDTDGLLRQHGSEEPLDAIVLPAPQSPLITGVIRRAGQPESGLTVDAIDAETGRIVSTRFSTACGQGKPSSCGSFSLGLAPGIKTYDLRLRRSSDPAYPTVVFPGLSTIGNLPAHLTSLPYLGQPALFRLGLEGVVDLPGKARAYDTVARARVVLEGSTRDGGRAHLAIHTNESGFLETHDGVPGALLYPGRYRAFIYPPLPLSASLPAYSFADIGPFDIVEGVNSYGPFVKTLSPLRKLLGKVQASGVAVPLARIIAEPVESDLPAPLTSFAVSDDSGNFSLRVDPALYRLTVEPPLESGLAWSTEALVDLRQADMSATINLPVPVALPLPGEVAALLGEGPIETSWYERREEEARLIYRRLAKRSIELVGLLPP